jgi:hypothetical protein
VMRYKNKRNVMKFRSFNDSTRHQHLEQIPTISLSRRKIKIIGIQKVT